MLDTISRFESDGLITFKEADAAWDAQTIGTDSHTIGYELEVLPAAALETPRVMRCRRDSKDSGLEAALELGPYAYGIDTKDGEYELHSPPASHPLPLAIATNGIARMGWLPKTPRGVVTAHVSIGSTQNSLHHSATHPRLVNLLRSVELAGGSTPGRLCAPVRLSREHPDSPGSEISKFSWNQKGTLGVRIPVAPGINAQWRGRNKRVEFRTIRYQSPDQFAGTLERLYFLTRGLLSKDDTPARAIYDGFETWFSDYCQARNLSDVTMAVEGVSISDPQVLDGYIRPYAMHLGDGDTSSLRTRMSETVGRLAEEFGMPHAAG